MLVTLACAVIALASVKTGFGGGWVLARDGWYGHDNGRKHSRWNIGTRYFDTKTEKLIWRGTASDTLSSKPEKNEDKLDKSVSEMFKHFPPPPKG